MAKDCRALLEEGSNECSMPGIDAIPRDACGQAVSESAHELFFVKARRCLSARSYLHALAALMATVLIAAGDAAVPLHEQLVEAGSRAFQRRPAIQDHICRRHGARRIHLLRPH